VFRIEIPLEPDANLEVEREEAAAAAAAGQVDSAILKPLVLELHGSSFEHRAPDRATRKFVLHMPDL
jgi:hypothetical protein